MSEAVHASAVLVGERGVLIRGVSGAGKSLMALALVGRVRREGGFAALIADDRVWLDVASDRLIARGAPISPGCASAAARVWSRFRTKRAPSCASSSIYPSAASRRLACRTRPIYM